MISQYWNINNSVQVVVILQFPPVVRLGEGLIHIEEDLSFLWLLDPPAVLLPLLPLFRLKTT